MPVVLEPGSSLSTMGWGTALVDTVEPDREGLEAMDDRLAAGESQSGARFSEQGMSGCLVTV